MDSEHQERIDLHTNPRIVREHVLRYRFALPAVQASDVWIDLGCGRGLAAVQALGDVPRPERMLLVDRDGEALQAAAAALDVPVADAFSLDLSSEDGIGDLERVAQEALGGRRACVTCFEVIEHLDDFVPLVGLLRRLAEIPDVTVVMSVPNDSFWAMHNPHHKTTWGGEAFEEFRMLLPDQALVAHQVALAGSCVQPLDAPADELSYRLPIEIELGRVPTHYLVAFGPSAARLTGIAEIAQADLDSQRAWERQREVNLEWLRQREEDLLYHEREARRLSSELDAMRAANSAT